MKVTKKCRQYKHTPKWLHTNDQYTIHLFCWASVGGQLTGNQCFVETLIKLPLSEQFLSGTANICEQFRVYCALTTRDSRDVRKERWRCIVTPQNYGTYIAWNLTRQLFMNFICHIKIAHVDEALRKPSLTNSSF